MQVIELFLNAIIREKHQNGLGKYDLVILLLKTDSNKLTGLGVKPRMQNSL